MNYSGGGGGGYPGQPNFGGGGYPGYAPPNYQPQQQQQQAFDQYGNPLYSAQSFRDMQGQTAPQGGGQMEYPQQGQQQQQQQSSSYGGLSGAAECPSFIPRDPRSAAPNNTTTAAYSRQPQQQGDKQTGGGGGERILRNPHPSIPSYDTMGYDPQLPTYNCTPIFPSAAGGNSYSKPTSLNPQQITVPVDGPIISRIFQAAEEKYSQMTRGATTTAPAPVPVPAPVSQPTASKKEDSAQQPTEIITGVVTQMQDMFGMVSNLCFFQVSTVVGTPPVVGDKVVVEAERVTGMPFKFNGKRVQVVSKDLLSHDKEKSKDQRRKSSPPSTKTSKRKESMNFGPLPSMPSSLNLPQGGSNPLKSILRKRNAPPPPRISEPKIGSSISNNTGYSGMETYRPESPVGFKNGLFSLDLRHEFPIIKQPSTLEQLYPELMFVSESVDHQRREITGRRELSPAYARRSSPEISASSRRDRKSRSPEKYKRRSRSVSPKPKRRSRSPKRRSITPKRRSRSPKRRSLSPLKRRSRSPKRKSRSRSPKKRRSITPKRRSRSPRKRSRTPVKRRSRSPKRKSRSRSPKRRSLSPLKRRPRSPKRRSPSPKRYSSTAAASSRSKSKRSLSPQRKSENSRREEESRRFEDSLRSSSPIVLYASAGEGNNALNPFGEKSGIIGTVGSSSLLPRTQDAFKIQDNNLQTNFYGQTQNTVPQSSQPQSSKVSRQLPAPIKFSIGGQPGTLVPNPAYAPPRPTSNKNSPTFIPNPAFQSANKGPLPQAVILPNPSAIVAQVEQAIKRSRRKRKDSAQEPAYKVVVPNPPPPAQVQANNTTKNQLYQNNITLVGKGAQKPPQQVNLTEADKIQMWEQERQLIKQKKTLDEQLNVQNTSQLQNLKKTVDVKLKGLREKFEANQTGGKSSQQVVQNKTTTSRTRKPEASGSSSSVQQQPTEEQLEKLQDEIQLQKYLEEERRLKSIGDTLGLEHLWLEEDRRRRRLEETRLERVRIREIKLKKDKNWTELKKLREEMGGTAEREMELMRLKELRAKEEMADEDLLVGGYRQPEVEDEHMRWQMEEQEVYMRAEERAQRGCEGPVRRLIMDTEIRQLNAADLLPEGPSGVMYANEHEESSRRSRGRDSSRDRRHRGERSPQRESRGSGSSSSRRNRRSAEREEVYYDDRRQREAEEEELRIRFQMEEMHRHEEELQRREAEIAERMVMMQRGMYVEDEYDDSGGHHHRREEAYERERERDRGRRSRY